MCVVWCLCAHGRASEKWGGWPDLARRVGISRGCSLVRFVLQVCAWAVFQWGFVFLCLVCRP